MKLTHLFTFFSSLGGVQGCLRRHIKKDQEYGLHSNALVFFEGSVNESVSGLGLSGYSNIATARKRFALQASALHPFAVYHNAWGINMFVDLDRAARRIAVIHSHWPELAADLGHSAGLFDGCLAVSQQLVNVVANTLPELSGRIQFLPYPVSGPWFADQPPLQNRELRLGYVGRLQRDQKRLERLPPLLATLRKGDVPFSIDLIGDGPFRRPLERRLRSFKPTFHGPLQGATYWRALQNLDFIIYTSDYEGLPISLLEGLSVGVLPIYPRINSGGDAYVSAVDPGALYGQPAEIVPYLHRMRALAPQEMQAVRERCVSMVRSHEAKNYHEVFGSFVRRINEMPRISAASFRPRRKTMVEWAPFGFLTRFARDAYFKTASPG